MPMEPIQVGRRKSYGSTLVNTKYSPLENIRLTTATDKASCSGILEYRRKLLTMAGLLPQPLNLTMPDWEAAAAAEVGRKPPLVVISTNRSKWIKKGLDEGGAVGPFENASDLTALITPTTAPPIYCPSRIGDAGERGIYIVVHASEYAKYKKTLAGTGMTVVGWEFTQPRTHRDMRKMLLSGFGASRFAAISFCKQLRTDALAAAEESEKEDTTVWDYAWLFDDNVVALGGFAGYAAVEKAMTDAAEAEDPHVCAGFHGGTSADPHEDIRGWAGTEVAEGVKKPASKRGKQADELPDSEPPDLVQQAVLWNIKYLTDQELNVGLVFVTSAEDVSITNYWDVTNTSYFYYKSIPIYKELAGNDSAGGSKIKTGRELLTSWLTHMESLAPKEAKPPPPPPPPISVSPNVPKDGGAQTLSEFVVKRVLPNSDNMKSKAGDISVQNSAKCQAVEQLTAEAIKENCVEEKTLKLIFSDEGQVVVKNDDGE
jgi:hypothetical protein